MMQMLTRLIFEMYLTHLNIVEIMFYEEIKNKLYQYISYGNIGLQMWAHHVHGFCSCAHVHGYACYKTD